MRYNLNHLQKLESEAIYALREVAAQFDGRYRCLFVEVYVRCPKDVCMKRDVKGMYKKALAGELKGFPGVDGLYEELEHPEIIVDTDTETVDENVKHILHTLKQLGYSK